MKRGGILKKSIAVILGMALTFSALMLPVGSVQNSFTTADAAVNIDGVIYHYSFENDRDVKGLCLNGIEGHGETVEIPSVINHEGVDYPVYKIGENFMKDDTTIKTIIFPESVKYISACTLYSSSVENITLPEGLEYLAVAFACDCKNLKSINYNGTSIRHIDGNTFLGSDLTYITNDKGRYVSGTGLSNILPTNL